MTYFAQGHKSQGLLREGPPPIISIDADLRLEGSKDDFPIRKNHNETSENDDYGEADLNFVFGPSPTRTKSDDTRIIVTNEKRGQQQRVRQRISSETREKEMPSPPFDSHYRQYPVTQYPYHYHTDSNQISNWGSSVMGSPAIPTPLRGNEQFMIVDNRRVTSHDSGKENEVPSSQQPRTSGSDWSPLKEKKESGITSDDRKDTKKKVLIRSPPMKKRRVVESWNDHEHDGLDADLVASSPFGVFRSPSSDKIKRRVALVCYYFYVGPSACLFPP